MLLTEFDPNPSAVINPSMAHKPLPDMPETMVSCFSRVTFARMVESLNAQPIAHIKSANMVYPVYRAVYGDVPVALMMAGVGAPLCVGNLEEAFALGVKRVILFGNCGVLNQSIADCSVILPTAALRDEGTSFHYAPPSDEIELNPRYRAEFLHLLDECGVSHTQGKTWTTDAFFRETPEKVRHRRAQGCVCVEMEAAAVAALAQFRGKDAFIFFYAGDNLDSDAWDPRSLSAHDKVEEKDRVALLALELARRITPHETT
ncbi:MAG: nucleoside phosphorylase [Aristaeellaceae bacterium]